MKILVTGGAGFIGSHLCERLLRDDHEVASFDNFNPFYDPAIKRRNVEDIAGGVSAGRFVSIEGDLRDAASVREAFRRTKWDAVIHLAAMAGVRPSIEDPALYESVNQLGTVTLLEECRRSGVRNFVFASSSSVYGNNPKTPFSESDSVDRPISPYAATKKAGELICHTYAHLFRMRIACLRFFTVYGPRQRPDLAIHKFTRLMWKGEEIPFFGDGSMRRDYTYVDDTIQGVAGALEWVRRGGDGMRYDIFNLGESRTVSLSELVAALESATGLRARLKRLPPQPGDVEVTYADVTKASRELGYRPSVPLEEGLRRFVAWYRNLNGEPSAGHSGG